ncbi:MAG: ABC transporter ATP-binding protein [Defluviitaleaceae bacterium]|nr:ABC transporter ATP-binding protein [Defluviitaleaceae bacterium]
MKISNITKKFSRFSLDWRRTDTFESKIYGIIGANGCGKTTLMKIMAGLVKPDEGEIDHGGLTPRDITMVFRKPYLMGDTVYKNLVYPLKIRKITPDEGRVSGLLELAGLSEIRNQYAPSLSSGEQQKLSFIRALIFDPKMILIDEAFSNMDIKSVTRFEQHILASQQKNPITWVIISHQLSNIKRLCNHVYFMDSGQFQAEGTPEQILLDPQAPELKSYLYQQSF